MTRCQELEMRRFTRAMWEVLQHAEQMYPVPVEAFGNYLRTARILERRGFVTVFPRKDSFHLVSITEAGREAVERA